MLTEEIIDAIITLLQAEAESYGYDTVEDLIEEITQHNLYTEKEKALVELYDLVSVVSETGI